MERTELEEYKELINKIANQKRKIERYLHSNADDVDGVPYTTALKTLSKLRALQRMTPKKVREEYARTKLAIEE